MATGDDALAAGMSILTGTELANTLHTEVNLTRDFIAQRTDPPGTPRAIAKGGTGATTTAAARNNLDVFAKGQTYDRPTIDAAFTSRDTAIGAKASQVGLDSVYLGALAPAVYDRNLTGTRRAAYIQNDGLVGYSSSSERYKKNVHPFEVTDEQIAQLVVVSYQYRAAVAVDDRTEIGLIAERLVEAGLSWAVFFNDDDAPEGINYDMIGVAILPAVQRLLIRTADVETRLAALEARE